MGLIRAGKRDSDVVFVTMCQPQGPCHRLQGELKQNQSPPPRISWRSMESDLCIKLLCVFSPPPVRQPSAVTWENITPAPPPYFSLGGSAPLFSSLMESVL